ncbi:MAG: MATE family efflux transporter [Candidatus Bathyarchaeota archaeon]|nr:MATE family efflux transporter [Candidatus Bathyarchaeota archaeon]
MVDSSDDDSEYRTISRYRDRIIEGPILRTLMWLGIPPMLNQLVTIAYNVADAYWLSSYSELSVVAPRQTRPILMLFQALLNALNAANLSIVSQYIGGRSFKEATYEASRFMTASIVSGLSLCLLLLTLREYIFTVILSTPEEMLGYVIDYSGIISIDIFLNYIVLTYTTLLQALGDTRRPAFINIVAVTVNIILDPFLVLGIGPFPRLGVIGAALTDVIGKIISMSAMAYIFMKSYPEFKLKLTKDINVEWVCTVMRIGLPILATGSMNGFAFLLQLRIVNMLGVLAAAAYAIGFIIMDIADAALWGLTGATAVMIGQNIGAGEERRAREVALKSALVIFLSVAVGAAILYPIRWNLADVFADNTEIIEETSLFLQIVLPSLSFFGLFQVALSAGRGSGHTVIPTLIGVLRLWVLRILLGFILAFNMGMGSFGVWLSLALSNFIGGGLSLAWIKYGRWTKAVVRSKRIVKPIG